MQSLLGRSRWDAEALRDEVGLLERRTEQWRPATSSAIWNGVLCVPATFTAPMIGAAKGSVRRDPATDRLTAAAARSSAGVTRPVVMSSSKNHGRGVS
jgi:hypothetical protein